MTNAVDVLAVGGPANGRVWCLNKNRDGGMVSMVEVVSIGEEAGRLQYPVTKWWDAGMRRWFWIARRDVDQVADADILWETTVNNFQPAWDLIDLPAPDQDDDDNG